MSLLGGAADFSSRPAPCWALSSHTRVATRQMWSLLAWCQLFRINRLMTHKGVTGALGSPQERLGVLGKVGSTCGQTHLP